MTPPEEILAEMQPTLTHAEVAANNQMFSELTAELADTKRQLASLQKQVEAARVLRDQLEFVPHGTYGSYQVSYCAVADFDAALQEAR